MDRRQIEQLFYGEQDHERRFTQDFPILPDVWIAYGQDPSGRLELLLTPHNQSDAATLAQALRQRLANETQIALIRGWTSAPGRARVLFNEAVVLAEFSLWELLRVAMPLTDWWRRAVAGLGTDWSYEGLVQFAGRINAFNPARRERFSTDPKLLKRLISIVGAMECERQGRPQPMEEIAGPSLTTAQIDAFARLFAHLTDTAPEHAGVLWSVSRNRQASASVYRSRLTIKADAAARLFEAKATGIRWAVLDTGIDATHKAFARRNAEDGIDKPLPEGSRVSRTYDFLRIKKLLDPDLGDDRFRDEIVAKSAAAGLTRDKLDELQSDLRLSLQRGRSIDWDLLEPFLRIPHDANYLPPPDSHGTHVAGIIGANWPEAPQETPLEEPLRGICPDIELWDIRVLSPKAGDEFTIIAALQFIRHANAHKDLMLVHGVNLSLSVPHDVANFACGRTPVCEECERVVASGVVVVAAAGNRGFNKLAAPEGGAQGDYRYISITDPGNADSVITVGATHRLMPHTYGVSYFSSRGPTGDGRTKPDLVAPGERIDSCSLDGYYETMDGTSMAAPHVSGAAALLISRHRELIGQPARVKSVLVRSATDLGREPRFQGGGNLDVLRAMQSI